MNVEEAKKALVACKSIQEVEALNLSKDKRSGVKKALANKLAELNKPAATPPAETPPAETPPETPPAGGAAGTPPAGETAGTPPETPPAGESAGKPPATYAGSTFKGSDKLSEKEQKIETFKGKIGYGCRSHSIIAFAEVFFGDDFISADKVDGSFNVKIVLKGKGKKNDSFEMRGI